MYPEIRESVARLKPYYKAPLEGKPLRLDQNTNLMGANPALAKVDPQALDVTLYPTRDGDALVAALADWYGVAPGAICLGNGSDEILDIVCKTVVPEGGTVAFPWPSYALYPYYADLMGLQQLRLPLTRDLRFDVDAILEVKGQADLLILANPNNPTGRAMTDEELERVLDEWEGWILLDEAYIEYHGLAKSKLLDTARRPNLIVLRTFSKAYGLAGLRIGVAVAHPDVASRLLVAKPPFNLNLYSEAIGVQAIQEQAWVDHGVRVVREERQALLEGLRGLGLRPVPTDANFLLAHLPAGRSGAEVTKGLLQRGILVRSFPAEATIADCIRITIGGPQHTERLLQALADVLEAGA